MEAHLLGLVLLPFSFTIDLPAQIEPQSREPGNYLDLYQFIF